MGAEDSHWSLPPLGLSHQRRSPPLDLSFCQTSIMNDLEELVEAAEHLERFSREQIDAGALGQLDGPLEVFTVYWLARAHRTFAAGAALCRQGYAVESAMQVRTLTEDLINLRVILDRPELVTRFAEFDAVQKMWTLDAVRGLPQEQFAEVRDEWLGQAQPIEAAFGEFRRKYADDFDKVKWAGKNKTVRKLASDSQSEELYAVFYSYCSGIVHGAPDASKHYIEIDDEGAPTFLMSDRESRRLKLLRLLVTVFSLFWDEISIARGAPTWGELQEVARNEWFEHFSRRRHQDP